MCYIKKCVSSRYKCHLPNKYHICICYIHIDVTYILVSYQYIHGDCDLNTYLTQNSYFILQIHVTHSNASVSSDVQYPCVKTSSVYHSYTSHLRPLYKWHIQMIMSYLYKCPVRTCHIPYCCRIAHPHVSIRIIYNTYWFYIEETHSAMYV